MMMLQGVVAWIVYTWCYIIVCGCHLVFEKPWNLPGCKSVWMVRYNNNKQVTIAIGNRVYCRYIKQTTNECLFVTNGLHPPPNNRETLWWFCGWTCAPLQNSFTVPTQPGVHPVATALSEWCGTESNLQYDCTTIMLACFDMVVFGTTRSRELKMAVFFPSIFVLAIALYISSDTNFFFWVIPMVSCVVFFFLTRCSSSSRRSTTVTTVSLLPRQVQEPRRSSTIITTTYPRTIKDELFFFFLFENNPLHYQSILLGVGIVYVVWRTTELSHHWGVNLFVCLLAVTFLVVCCIMVLWNTRRSSSSSSSSSLSSSSLPPLAHLPLLSQKSSPAPACETSRRFSSSSVTFTCISTYLKWSDVHRLASTCVSVAYLVRFYAQPFQLVMRKQLHSPSWEVHVARYAQRTLPESLVLVVEQQQLPRSSSVSRTLREQEDEKTQYFCSWKLLVPFAQRLQKLVLQHHVFLLQDPQHHLEFTALRSLDIQFTSDVDLADLPPLLTHLVVETLKTDTEVGRPLPRVLQTLESLHITGSMSTFAEETDQYGVHMKKLHTLQLLLHTDSYKREEEEEAEEEKGKKKKQSVAGEKWIRTCRNLKNLKLCVTEIAPLQWMVARWTHLEQLVIIVPDSRDSMVGVWDLSSLRNLAELSVPNSNFQAALVLPPTLTSLSTSPCAFSTTSDFVCPRLRKLEIMVPDHFDDSTHREKMKSAYERLSTVCGDIETLFFCGYLATSSSPYCKTLDILQCLGPMPRLHTLETRESVDVCDPELHSCLASFSCLRKFSCRRPSNQVVFSYPRVSPTINIAHIHLFVDSIFIPWY